MVEGYVFDATRQRYFRSRTAADGRPEEGTHLRSPQRRACYRHPAPSSPSIAFLLQKRDVGALSGVRFASASQQLVHRSTASWPAYERFLASTTAAPPSHRPDGIGRWLLDFHQNFGVAVGKGEGWAAVTPDVPLLLSGELQGIERARPAGGTVCAIEWRPTAVHDAALLVVASTGRKSSASVYSPGTREGCAVAELPTSCWSGTWHRREQLVALALPRAAAVIDMQSPSRQSHWRLPSDVMSLAFLEAGRLLCGLRSGQVHGVDLRSARPSCVLSGSRSVAYMRSLSNEDLLVTRDVFEEVQLWDARHSRQPVVRYGAPCLRLPKSIVWGQFCISHDERILYSSKGDQLCAWALLDGRLLSHCDAWNGAVHSSMLLANGLSAAGPANGLNIFAVEGFLCPHTSVALQYHPLLGL